jgi:hypothetical protein
MSTITTMIAVGRWSKRTNLQYVPCNEKAAGQKYNAFGVPNSAAMDPTITRRPYKIEENGSTTYIMYDDDTYSDVAIYRIQEA